MSLNKTIFVTGATGNQGGAVLRSLVQKGFSIKALTRNIHSAKAQVLQQPNVHLVKGDLNNTSTYREHLNGVDGIFSVQTFEHGVDKEIDQGIKLATTAKEYGIKHFLYSSGLGADLNTGIPHFDSKIKIEDHVKQLNLPFTIIRPGSLFENFLLPQVKNRIVKGKLPSPVNKEVIQQFISSTDIGNISTAIFLNPDKYIGRTILIASEQLDMQQIAAIFSKALEKKIKYQKLPMFIARVAMGKELYKMFKWLNKQNSFSKETVDSTWLEFPNLLILESWIKLHFQTET